MIGVPIARVLGIEIRVQLGWVLVVALVAALAVIQVGTAVPTLPAPVQWILGGAVGIAFFVSAMLHDLGHAVVARRRGVVVESILVSFFGGTTPADATAPVARDDLAIAASGPVVSVVLGVVLAAIALGLDSLGTEMGVALGQIVIVLAVLNVLIGLVNFIPAYPLDGGRIVRALAWGRSGSVKGGWKAAAATGRLSGLVGLSIGGGLFLTGEITNGAMVALSGWFLILSSRAIRERLKVDALIGDLVVSDAMERNPTTVNASLTVDTLAGQLLDGETPTTAIPVMEGTAVVGMLGVREVRRLRRGAWGITRVGDAMTRPPRMVELAPGAGLVDAVERLHRSGLDGLPVILDGALQGVLTRRSVGQVVRDRTASQPAAGR
ncbi:MAG: CBS domain-containing protein [Chloroflexota bacterium]|nr:MAG: CBS domain-containing protein [Chloroflexota bacterium]